MTTPAKPDVCPKCGAAKNRKRGGEFECGSKMEVHGYPQPLLPFEQSDKCKDKCRIAELQAALARVTEGNERLKEERDNAVGNQMKMALSDQYEREKLEQQLARVTEDRDEAAGLLRRARLEVEYAASQTPGKNHKADAEELGCSIRAYLSRLDQPQSPEQEKT